jgi:hypothetical protein
LAEKAAGFGFARVAADPGSPTKLLGSVSPTKLLGSA